MRDSKKSWKSKKVISIPRRIIYYQMIINCTYSPLVVTITMSLWVLLLLNWYRHVRDSTKNKAAKTASRIGRSRKKYTKWERSQTVWLYDILKSNIITCFKNVQVYIFGLLFLISVNGDLISKLYPCFYETFLLILWEKSLIQNFVVFWSDFKKLYSCKVLNSVKWRHITNVQNISSMVFFALFC